MADSLTLASIVRMRQTPAVVGVSVSTIRRLMQRGDFPPLVRLGVQSVGFLRSDLEAWLAARRGVTA